MTEIDQAIEHGGCPGEFAGAGNDMSMHLSLADFVRIQKDTPIYRYMGLEEFHCLIFWGSFFGGQVFHRNISVGGYLE